MYGTVISSEDNNAVVGLDFIAGVKADNPSSLL